MLNQTWWWRLDSVHQLNSNPFGRIQPQMKRMNAVEEDDYSILIGVFICIHPRGIAIENFWTNNVW